MIRATEQIGIQIPRFCDHPLLASLGACRQCMVEIATPGTDDTLRPMPKPMASCRTSGRTTSPFEDVKRTYPKPVSISSQALLDRERCVLSARCTRFSDQIAGDPFIALVERGVLQQIGIYQDKPFESYCLYKVLRQPMLLR